MAIWPFGRKSKKTSHADDQARPPAKDMPPEGSRRELVQEASDRSVPTLGRRLSRKESQKRARSASRKLSKTNAPSYRNVDKEDAIPPIPALPEERRNELNEKSGANKSNQRYPASRDRGDVPSYYFQNPMSASSLQPEKFTAIRQPPTLQGKRSANDQNLPRRKSSKRKADDHAREQEVKAMSSPIPIPRRLTSHQSGLLARDSKKIPGGMNRNLERPLSDVSLPLPESMKSQMSVVSDQHAFKISAFDALSPRPTIRYSGNPRRSPPGSSRPSRTSTRKEKQPVIPEESAESRRRIDDLADEMDAGSLRELMERDWKRHEKQRRSEHERLQRRLQRRADKQKEREAKVEGDVGVGPKDQGLENVGLGIGETSTEPNRATTVAAPTREEKTKTPDSWLHDPSKEQLSLANPFHDPVVEATASHLEEATPTEERDEPILGGAKGTRLSSASMSPPVSPTRHAHEPSNLSQFSELASSTTPDYSEKAEGDHHRDSDPSVRFSTWKSIFRRSDTRAKRDSTDRGRVTPSEFSNTSRESFARQMPPSAFTRIPRARSGTPIRTQSRFKEDLPELPISPPDSRMQSPEGTGLAGLSDIPGSRGTDVAGGDGQPLSDIHPAYREEVALSRHASLRATSPEVPNSATLSQSLASVDSEGSWLTGRPVKRSSQPQPLRESAGSFDRPLHELGGSDEEDDIPGTPDEQKYMGRLTPAPSEGPVALDAPAVPQRRRPYMNPPAGLAGDSDDESSLHRAAMASAQEEGTWHGAVGKHPTIVRHGPGPRARSREGLLNDFQTAAVESNDSSPSGDSPVGPDSAFIQRATSVDLGKGHARHISAGSARLLNLPPRSSNDLKRFSASSGERSTVGASAQPSPRLAERTDEELD